jgi:hypothetical protein
VGEVNVSRRRCRLVVGLAHFGDLDPYEHGGQWVRVQGCAGAVRNSCCGRSLQRPGIVAAAGWWRQCLRSADGWLLHR